MFSYVMQMRENIRRSAANWKNGGLLVLLSGIEIAGRSCEDMEIRTADEC